MGHRANFVVIQDGQPTLYYSHWAAVTLTHSLFFGPEFALRDIETLLPTDALLDDVWCEAAAIIDRDARRLLFFVRDTRYRPNLRRYFLPLLGHNWPGWEVRWANQGVVDIALYLGIDPAEVRDEEAEGWSFEETDLETSPQFITSLITVGFLDNAIDYGFEDSLTQILVRGPGLIDLLPGRAGAPLREDEDLECGAFLDPARREMWVWWSGTADDRRVDRIANLWPGWTVRRHNGGLREHVRLSGRDATPLEIDEAEAIRRIVTLLSEDNSFDPGNALASILGDRSGADAQVGHGFFRADRPAFDANTKTEILRQTIAAFRTGAIRPEPMAG